MRIDDTDPDELDDAGGGGRRRAWLLAGGGALLVAGLVAAVLILRGSGEGTTAATTTTAPVPDTAPADTVAPDVTADADLNPFPDYGSDYSGPKLEPILHRVTDTGIRLALQDSGDWNNIGGEAVDVVVPAPTTALDGGWTAPEWCAPVGGFRMTMTYKDAVGVSNGSRYSAPRDGGFNVTLFSSGYAENTPFRVLVLQVAGDVTQVSAQWSDGSGDAAMPTKGFVALATPGVAGTRFDITLQSATGETVVQWADLPREGDLAWQKACNPPPPELPPAGEQPADAAAAEQQIRDNFDLLWSQDVDFEDKATLLDDATGVQDAIDAVFNGGFAGAAESAVHTIGDIVFTSPSEAWFQYDITTTAGNFTGRFGIAYLIDGRWRFARAVICQDLSLAGGQCEPFVDQIYPPGSNLGGTGDVTVATTVLEE